MAAKSNNAPLENSSFSESATALDEIIKQLKTGSLSLEDSLELFENGIQHLKVCQGKLTTAKGKVEELVKTLQEDGESVTEAFEW